jgi:hypothetical protein
MTLHRIYLAVAAALLAWWLAATMGGWEFGTPARQSLPGDVRALPGGYRTFHYWHDGYHGGK